MYLDKIYNTGLARKTVQIRRISKRDTEFSRQFCHTLRLR